MFISRFIYNYYLNYYFYNKIYKIKFKITLIIYVYINIYIKEENNESEKRGVNVQILDICTVIYCRIQALLLADGKY